MATKSLMQNAVKPLSIPETINRATSELGVIRVELETIFLLALTPSELCKYGSADFVRAAQSVDLMTQRIAAIECFLRNVVPVLSEDSLISVAEAMKGVHLSDFIKKLSGVDEASTLASGELELF